VIREKPMTINAPEAMRMIDAAKKSTENCASDTECTTTIIFKG